MTNKYVDALLLVSITNNWDYQQKKSVKDCFIVSAKAKDNKTSSNDFVNSMIFDDYFQTIEDVLGDSRLEKSKFSHLENGLYVMETRCFSEVWSGPDGTDYDGGIDMAKSVRPFNHPDDYDFFYKLEGFGE